MISGIENAGVKLKEFDEILKNGFQPRPQVKVNIGLGKI